MRRAPLYVVTGAVAGFAAVLGLHGQSGSPVALGQARSTAGTPKARGTTAPPGSPGGSGAATAGGAPSGAPSAAAAPPGVHSAIGTLEQYGYGELSVRITANGSRITAVSVPTLRTAEPYSQQLAQQVIPMLRSEVLSAHSGRINGVSGATYTSEAYAASLQSALDKLHIR